MKAQRDSEGQAETHHALVLIEQLVERWCDRRALQPLRHLLPVYP